MSREVKMGKGINSWRGNYGDQGVKTITFCVTEDCNLVCRYCYMTGKNNKKSMSFEVAKKAIDYIFNNPDEFKENSVVFDFIGGEPFLEVDLIDKICDYLKVKMLMLRPDWFDSYRFSFSSNGLLYSTDKVQKFISKHKSHLYIGISIDGNEKKHNLQRVFKDGSGSYEKVMKNVSLWKEQMNGNGTKATFSSDDLPYLKESIISLWNNGIEDASANIVFEDVWKDDDDKVMENQLNQLGDYILENKLWDKYSVRFFDSSIGNPLSEENKKHNFCGAGKMLAIDCEGNFYPCIRFLDFSLNNRKGRCIGNCENGINEDKLRAFRCLTMENQSKKECLDCQVATGCALCTGFNYDENGSIFERATNICKMHKATVRANKRFWRKYEDITGEVSPRRQYENYESYRYIQVMTSDKVTPHCNYRNINNMNNIMDNTTIDKAIKFGIDNGYEIAFLGQPPKEFNFKNPSIMYLVDESEDKIHNKDQYITIYNNKVKKEEEVAGNNILLISKDNLDNLYELIKKLIKNSERINVILQDTVDWTEKELMKYGIELDKVIRLIEGEYENENYVEVSVLTDRIYYERHQNCTNGFNTFTLAPNGKFYVCPAFYFNNPKDSIGDLDSGIETGLKNQMDIKNSLICDNCDAYQCKACKFENKQATEEYLIPSKIQCLISTLERNKAKDLHESLKKLDEKFEDVLISKIEYKDPMELVLNKIN